MFSAQMLKNSVFFPLRKSKKFRKPNLKMTALSFYWTFHKTSTGPTASKKMVRDFIIHDGTREKRDFGWNSFGRNDEDRVDVVPSRIEYLG